MATTLLSACRAVARMGDACAATCITGASRRATADSAASAGALRCYSTSSPLRSALRASRPLLQGKAAKGGKGGGPATAAPVETFDLKKQVPVNILKDGPEPEYQADTEYPPWLFELLADKPPVEDLMMKGVEKMTPEEMKVVIRTVSKRRIKDRNSTSAKAGEE